MAERLKSGEIIGMVYSEGGKKRKELFVNYFKVNVLDGNTTLQFPLNTCEYEEEYLPSDYTGIMHTFSELESNLLPQNIDYEKKGILPPGVRKYIDPLKKIGEEKGTQLSFLELKSYLKRKRIKTSPDLADTALSKDNGVTLK